jgi:hypothetical protein
MKQLKTLTKSPYDAEDKEKVEAECRRTLEALTRAFLGQIKTPDMVPVAMEHLSMIHFTILLHRFKPEFWERLLVTYNEAMYDRFEEVEGFLEWERKNERETDPKVS